MWRSRWSASTGFPRYLNWAESLPGSSVQAVVSADTFAVHDRTGRAARPQRLDRSAGPVQRTGHRHQKPRTIIICRPGRAITLATADASPSPRPRGQVLRKPPNRGSGDLYCATTTAGDGSEHGMTSPANLADL